jgi:hypothetical protein
MSKTIPLPALILWSMHSSLEEKKNHEFIYSLVHHVAGMMMLWSSRASDPLVHHGRHFGRTGHAMCNVQALITSGITLLAEEGQVTEESLTSQSVSFPSLPIN